LLHSLTGLEDPAGDTLTLYWMSRLMLSAGGKRNRLLACTGPMPMRVQGSPAFILYSAVAQVSKSLRLKTFSCPILRPPSAMGAEGRGLEELLDCLWLELDDPWETELELDPHPKHGHPCMQSI